MTSKRIAELRRLAEAATPGPWYTPEDARPVKSTSLMSRPAKIAVIGELRSSDAAYIVAACNAIPELLDELEALQWEVVRVAPFLAVHGFEGYAVGAPGQATKEETG